jgi:hypothetical protein
VATINYTKSEVKVWKSTESDYRPSEFASGAITDEVEVEVLLDLTKSCGTGGQTFDMAFFDVSLGQGWVIIKNNDATNFVTVEWTSNVPGTNKEDLYPGAWMKIVDLDRANDLVITADTGPCECRVIVAALEYDAP